MRLPFFSLCCCLFFSLPLSAEAELKLLIEDFERYFAAQLDEHNIPGGAYAVVYKDQIISTGGVGVRQLGSNEPVDPYTIFRIASVSKTFAAGLASIVASEGHFKWDEPITHYVPGFSFKTPRFNNQLKIEHLLSQSTGVVRNAYDNLIEANQAPDRILPYFSKIDPLCPPGRCYGYQNVLFSLIEPVLEQTTNTPYAELMEKRIFQPLNMTTASVGMAGFLLAENKAMPHVRARARGKWYPTKVSEEYYRFSPAAGVNASAVDLGQWLIAQLGHKPEVFPDSMLSQITAKRVKTLRDLRRKEWREYLTDAHYALGWRIYQFGEDELVYHGGWVRGYRTDVAYSRHHQLGMVILLNAESNIANDLSTYFWSRMFKAMNTQQAAAKLIKQP